MDGLTSLVTKNRVYLAGAIEHAPDKGKGWRAELEDFLRKRNWHVFNPCTEEAFLLSPEEKGHLREWKQSDTERFRKVIRKFVDNDVKALSERTAFVVALWDCYAARGAGTAGEITLAYFLGIPVFLVCQCPLPEVPGWILACATEIYSDWESLKRRLAEMPAPDVYASKP